MKKNELATEVALKCGITVKEALEVIDSINVSIVNEVKNGKNVSIYGFGTFEPKTTRDRMGINPQTKERLLIKGSNGVRFKITKIFKKELNS